jgi:cyclopropane fatty-acyl-phospholipid synthase-like methyltransferase
MNKDQDTKRLYDEQASHWQRTGPVLLSDYSARPFVMDLCEPHKGYSILDIGCGEGYVGRELLKRGATHIHGIDISDSMIEKAEAEKQKLGLQSATYEVRDIRGLEDSEFQVETVLAMFLFNYLNASDTAEVMKKAYTQLKPGGHFIFSVPHPSLAFLKHDKYPFYFEKRGGYFSGRNILFPGEIWRRDGIAVGVQCVHKTFEDYFTALRYAGFIHMPEVHELRIHDEHVALDPEFFTPLIDLPLHVAFKVKK